MKQLIKTWQEEPLITYKLKDLEPLNLVTPQITFLTTIGLPEDAAPLLSFNSELESINSCYHLEDSNYDSKIVLGSDGGGDPICIDLTTLKIYACDHELGFESKFMNTSVIHLFKFLTYFKDFVDQLIATKGEDAFFDCNFTDEELNELTIKMKVADPLALEPNTFWHNEIRNHESQQIISLIRDLKLKFSIPIINHNYNRKESGLIISLQLK